MAFFLGMGGDSVLGRACRGLRLKLAVFPFWQYLYPSLLPPLPQHSFTFEEIDGGKVFLKLVAYLLILDSRVQLKSCGLYIYRSSYL